MCPTLRDALDHEIEVVGSDDWHVRVVKWPQAVDGYQVIVEEQWQFRTTAGEETAGTTATDVKGGRNDMLIEFVAVPSGIFPRSHEPLFLAVPERDADGTLRPKAEPRNLSGDIDQHCAVHPVVEGASAKIV